MPKLKTGIILPTLAEDAAITAAALADSDVIPFTDAEWLEVKPLVRRGQPLGNGSKILSPDTPTLGRGGGGKI